MEYTQNGEGLTVVTRNTVELLRDTGHDVWCAIIGCPDDVDTLHPIATEEIK